MKKTIFTLLIYLCVFFGYAQNFCLTDNLKNEPEKKLTSFDKKAKIHQDEIHTSAAEKKFLLSKEISISNEDKYEGPIYSIPVVVHIIVPNKEVEGTPFNPTDVQIQTWIENCNKIFATTFGGVYFLEGDGVDGGTVMPFKLVLSKRNENCKDDTGIVRYYSTEEKLPNYIATGLNANETTGATAGPTPNDIRKISPHWPESSFYNIYVVSGINGTFTYGSTAFANNPDVKDSEYDAFIASRLVTDEDSAILAHEIGHALGLIHVFGGGGYSTKVNACPLPETPENCSKVNDKVCDTAPCKAYLDPQPKNDEKNPCTGKNYDGTQNNIMGYSKARKFTPGQRERALVQFLSLRENLTTSLGGTAIDLNSINTKLDKAACKITSPVTIANGWMGPTLVQLANIKNSSLPRRVDNQETYIDYSVENCYNATVYTDLTIGETYTLTVGYMSNPQFIKAWIDYNNDGSFDATELIATSGVELNPKDDSHTNTLWLQDFVPPATAVTNIPIRFRVRAGDNKGPCDPENYGQVEDYTVKLISKTLSTTENQTTKYSVWYSNKDNKLISNTIIATYKIYDINGKIIQEGISDTKEVNLKFSQMGMYIFKNKTTTLKFVK